MGKMISIPVEGGATTKAVIGAVTVTNGVITAIGGAGVVVGVAYTTVPTVTIGTTDGQGQGAVIIASTLSSGVPTFSIINGGTGYTSASTVTTTVTPPLIYINADQVVSIAPVATGATGALNTTVVIKMNTPTTPTLTLTLANPLNAAAPFATGADPVATRLAIINAINSATNVKLTDQITPVVMPNTVIVTQYAYS